MHRDLPTATLARMEDAGSIELTPREKAILDFERGWWRQEGSKESAIRAQLDLSATRYYELLQHLCDVPAARAYDPLVIHRLRRLRDRRRRARFEGRTAGGPNVR